MSQINSCRTYCLLQEYADKRIGGHLGRRPLVPSSANGVSGWELRGIHCYKFFNIRHSWEKAAELCRRYGSELMVVESYSENNMSASMIGRHLDRYWLGLASLDDLRTNTLESAAGMLVSQYAGFWAPRQPNPHSGECVDVALTDDRQTWELTTCESLLPFMCRANACPSGSFHCSNGKCINAAFKCDKQDDCGDYSDELDCPANCQYYMASSGDVVESPNYPHKYGPLSNCKWTLEGPQGHNILLQFQEFETEKSFDIVQILAGGRTEEKSMNVATLSGKQELSNQLFVSGSNFMIIKFSTDASVERKGFRASWKTEPQNCSGTLRATPQGQVLTSPGYPQNYPGGLECLYTLQAQPGRILSLEIEDLDLEMNRDYILIRDGDSPMSRPIARLTGKSEDNPNKVIMSTGNNLYLYFKTSLGDSRRGFSIRFTQGCKATIIARNGTVQSPSYGLNDYPNNQECLYKIRNLDRGPLSLKFTDFNVHQTDYVQIYDGSNTNGLRLHPEGGFTSNTRPKITLTAESGEMLVRFASDALHSSSGWQAEFSADCPPLQPGDGALASSRDTAFGTVVTFSCPLGQEFATGKSRISTECLPGGNWSITYIPKCQEVYCGPVPQIDNGFSIGSTNVTYRGLATYQCYAGFAFPSGRPTEKISCLADGRWEKKPSCLASQCAPLPEAPHSNITILNGGGRSYGTIVRFECEPGYVRSGHPVILCMSNGTWSDEVPTCSRATCPILPTIKNGFVVDIGRDYFFGDEARVQCNRGYKLTGSNIIQCGPYQRFDNVPTCEDINECASSQCDLASTECINNPGAFTCKCKSGFAPTMECRPIGDLGLINGGIPDESITVSSSENGYTKTGIRLNNGDGWCGNNIEPGANWVIIDMKAPTIIRGFRTQVVARIDGNIAYTSAVRIQYTDDITDAFKDYTNPDGTPVEFRILEPILSVLNLPVPIEARYVRFRIQDYAGAPCMKLEIMGCTRLECTDINECVIRNGGCHQKCINSPGSYSCMCNTGFELYKGNGTAGFNLAKSEFGERDGDLYQRNKTCVPLMCPPLTAPENGKLLSTKANAKCVSLPDDKNEGLSVIRSDEASVLVPFKQNVTLKCGSNGRYLRNTATSGFRQCVYDPKHGLPDYWLSGLPAACPRVDCGKPLPTPGAEYGTYLDTKYQSSFFFGCQDTFKLAGQTNRNDNVVRCQANGVWDFGNLRCEGPVCEDPGRPSDGYQVARSYEQSSEVQFGCSRPGYILINPRPIVCIREPECKVIKPLGLTSGRIPDSSINATSERPNYEARNVRLNSVTGWCGKQEAFTYVSVDLGRVYRVKAILVKGVITNDIVGRPTEIRFFYKRTEKDNYVVYFPNFNLTMRDPGNYGELAMITLPKFVDARFVILGIVSYMDNACLKFELMGCEDPVTEPLLGYDYGFSPCVDNEPPVFQNCPQQPIIVQKGADGELLPVNFTVPIAIDNSGSIARLEVKPQNFKTPIRIFEDTVVKYVAFDYDGNVAICEINITVPDVTPPKLSCPQSYVIELIDRQESYSINFNETRRRINATDASGPVKINFVPERAVIRIGGFENVTVYATDTSGNRATCHFQVSVQATPCVDWELKPPANGDLKCVPGDKGMQCIATCKAGYRFTDGVPVKSYACDVNKRWVPTSMVPDCVSENTQQADYHVTASVSYRANGAVSRSCLPMYQDLMSQYYINLNTILTQRCSAISVNVNVSFVKSMPFLIEENLLKMDFVLVIVPAVRQPKLYDLCGSTLNLIFDLSVPYASAVIEPLLNVSAIGNQCPPLRALKSSISRGFTCSVGEVLNMDTNDVPRCLHCPAGTFAGEKQKQCTSCPKGFYQNSDRQGACLRCPFGTYTKEDGSKSIDDCIPVCGYGTYSPTGLVPCLECPRNSYTGEPPIGGYKDCQTCPAGTFTYQPAAPGRDRCRAKCSPGMYSDTGLAPCAQCPKHFFQPQHGAITCVECPTNMYTDSSGAVGREECKPVQCTDSVCQHGGLCVPMGHGVHCYCPAGFSGRRCEVDIDECASQPCYNGATCIDLPQGYRCQCANAYSGINCQEEKTDCANDTCPERAMCKDEPGFNNYTCLCRSGYTGVDCDITINPCTASGNPCHNGANCVALQQGRYKCECLPGWEGQSCENNTDDCAERPCLLGANCTDLIADFSCDCPPGFTGKRCHEKIDLCSGNPCLNGICVDKLFHHECICHPGWTGAACETNINECALKPCRNNGHCPSGTDGKQCETAPERCIGNPCMHNGRCQDFGSGLNCTCPDDYTGIGCQYEYDACQAGACKNGATCIDEGPGFTCICPPGYTGPTCEDDIIDCKENSCPPSATCIDLTGKFYCQCPFNLTGDDCRKSIQVDYDLYFSDPGRSSASQIIPFFTGSTKSLTVAMWVQFTQRDEAGIFFSLYGVSSPHVPTNRRLMIQAHSNGVQVSLFHDLQDVYLPFREYATINDGQWHHVAVVWNGENGGELILITEGLIASKTEGYGSGRSLPAYAWAVLGKPQSENMKGYTESGFQGHLTKVQVWGRALHVTNEIQKQVRDCRTEPVLYQGLVLTWAGYDETVGGVERVVPSHCGQRVCPPGYGGNKCQQLEADKIPPKMEHCPGDLWVIAKNGSSIVTWDEPRFSDNVGIVKIQEKNGHRSGQTLLWGTYDISYVAYDQAGNSASCSFKVYVLSDFCPVLDDPIGGTQQCKDWGSGGQFKVCEIFCNDGLRFSQEVPKFYTCGAEGFWRPTNDPSLPLVYPACTSATSAQRVFRIKMNFPTSVLCNEAGQGVLKQKVRNAVNSLNRDWNFCSYSYEGTRECKDLNIDVQCDHRIRTTRETSEEDGGTYVVSAVVPAEPTRQGRQGSDTYEVEISFPAINDPILNANSNERSTVQKLLERLILEEDQFDVHDILPNTVPDPASLVLESDYACPIGQVVMAPDCVPCAVGTYYDEETQQCVSCPVGSYQSESGQLRCSSCPVIAGRPSVTVGPGARSAADCKERCPAGKYYDDVAGLCRSCGHGFYQPSEGSFSCLLCGLGKTTRTAEAVSREECRDECGSGQQLAVEGKCEPCPRGTYRTQGVQASCQACPLGRTTPNMGSAAIEECSLPVCEPGTHLNGTLNECVECKKGTYQSEPQQTFCIPCPPNTSTKGPAATSKADCTNPCETSGEEMHCDANAYCLLIPETSDFKCECKPGYNGTGTVCTDVCLGFCDNEGVCLKDSRGQPSCRCSGSFTGKHCTEKSEFFYITGGIAGGVILIIIVVLLVWMICVRASRKKEPKKMLTPATDQNGSQVNFYYGAPTPYAESIAPSHHSTYAHYYDDEEDGWEMPNFYNETYMKESLHNGGKMNSLARSNASIYGTKDDLYDRLKRHAYTGKKDKSDSDSEGQ
ncbi:Sushi, von Willebrand factor type A, EGF and pentraxin domain-containing protein [Ooceraea biroi]|uniref:Sushi, von Willebrand factor type A, EGF and pentraxin domain-containing protein n=1 Tax=Ooceraea biroi TaxID=2015173 RepID=A0A026W4W8_OOCBI|nr:Sushi, von Willebrand factor type A, EGF and pentraxin domain-containing protein [Ooceraea biroi]